MRLLQAAVEIAREEAAAAATAEVAALQTRCKQLEGEAEVARDVRAGAAAAAHEERDAAVAKIKQQAEA
jgi:hypothetical protein